MAPQPHGIARTLPERPPRRLHGRPALSGSASPVALARDLQKAVASLAEDIGALAESMARLSRHLDDVEDRLAHRVNDMILSGLLAERPPAGVADRIFFEIDT